MRVDPQILIGRRVFLQAAFAGAAAVANEVLPGGVSLGAPSRPDVVARQNYRIVQTSKRTLPLIVFWLGGGASHIDIELPEGAASPFRPTRTSVPGVVISDQLPRTARILNKVAFFRNITHNQSDHGPATALFFTGSDRLTNDRGDSRFNTPLNANAMAQAARYANSRYIALNASEPRAPYSGVEGRDPNSFSIRCNFTGDNSYPSPLNGGVSGERLTARLDLLRQMQGLGDLDSSDPRVAQFVETQQVGIDTLTSRLGPSFNLNRTDPRLRDRLGRNPLGNAALTAGNLINAGARFVTINDGFWDDHWDLEPNMRVLLPRLDNAFSGLLEMIEMGIIPEDTMVVIATEFGRAPVLTPPPEEISGTVGRDHWPLSSFAVVYGPEGVVQPEVVGSINRHARFTDKVIPYKAHEFWEAVLNGCGYAREELDRSGRPTGRMFPSLRLFHNKAA